MLKMPAKQLENEKTRYDTRLPKEQKRFFERAAVELPEERSWENFID